MSAGKMPEKIVIRARAAAGFFRLGRHWPKEGATVSADEFDEEGWDRLLADPNLHVEPASDEDAEPDQEQLRFLVRDAIGQLGSEDFTKEGKPKITTLRKLLPNGGKGLTQALVDEVWAELKPAGN